MYLNLNLTKHILDYKIKKEDKLDKDYKFKNYGEFVNSLTIPDGYTVEYVPEDFEYNNPKFSAHIRYKVRGNKIIYQHKVKMNFLGLKQNEFNEFNNFIKALDKSYKESIVLKKTN